MPQYTILPNSLTSLGVIHNAELDDGQIAAAQEFLAFIYPDIRAVHPEDRRTTAITEIIEHRTQENVLANLADEIYIALKSAETMPEWAPGSVCQSYFERVHATDEPKALEAVLAEIKLFLATADANEPIMMYLRDTYLTPPLNEFSDYLLQALASIYNLDIVIFTEIEDDTATETEDTLLEASYRFCSPFLYPKKIYLLKFENIRFCELRLSPLNNENILLSLPDPILEKIINSIGDIFTLLNLARTSRLLYNKTKPQLNKDLVRVILEKNSIIQSKFYIPFLYTNHPKNTPGETEHTVSPEKDIDTNSLIAWRLFFQMGIFINPPGSKLKRDEVENWNTAVAPHIRTLSETPTANLSDKYLSTDNVLDFDDIPLEVDDIYFLAFRTFLYFYMLFTSGIMDFKTGDLRKRHVTKGENEYLRGIEDAINHCIDSAEQGISSAWGWAADLLVYKKFVINTKDKQLFNNPAIETSAPTKDEQHRTKWQYHHYTLHMCRLFGVNTEKLETLGSAYLRVLIQFVSGEALNVCLQRAQNLFYNPLEIKRTPEPPRVKILNEQLAQLSGTLSASNIIAFLNRCRRSVIAYERQKQNLAIKSHIAAQEAGNPEQEVKEPVAKDTHAAFIDAQAKTSIPDTRTSERIINAILKTTTDRKRPAPALTTVTETSHGIFPPADKKTRTENADPISLALAALKAAEEKTQTPESVGDDQGNASVDVARKDDAAATDISVFFN